MSFKETSMDCNKVQNTSSPTPSSKSNLDGVDDGAKNGCEKFLGDTEDENMSGFDTDSDEDQLSQNGNG